MLLQWTLTLCYVVPFIVTALTAVGLQRDAEEAAVARGTPRWLVQIVRPLGFFTKYTVFWAALAEWTEHPTVVGIAVSLCRILPVLYLCMNTIDPCHISYHDPEMTRAAARILPPLNRYIVPWFGLNFGLNFIHYVAPALFLLKHAGTATNTWATFAAVLAWWWMHELSWIIQGVPSYPFLAHLRNTGQDGRFVALCMVGVLILG